MSIYLSINLCIHYRTYILYTLLCLAIAKDAIYLPVLWRRLRRAVAVGLLAAHLEVGPHAMRVEIERERFVGGHAKEAPDEQRRFRLEAASVPPNLTSVPVKLVPVITTVAPVLPVLGLKSVMAGRWLTIIPLGLLHPVIQL